MTDRRHSTRRRAAAVGMFDGVHPGHRLLVAEVCRMGRERGLPCEIFTFDRHPMQLIAPERAPSMLTTPSQRADLLAAAGADGVTILPFDRHLRNLDARQFLLMLHRRYDVDLLAIGFNHHFGRGAQGTFADYRAIGAEIGVDVEAAPEYIDTEAGRPVSSSAIRAMVAEGDIAGANAMLGHDFTILGTVMHGRSIGHTIGYPTANIMPAQPSQLLPRSGVYAAWVDVRGARLPAMVNIGSNPTVGGDAEKISVEAHLIGFDADIYSYPVGLVPVARLRDEHRFPSLQALQAQLAADREAALAILKNR